jgi:serine protease Do
MKNPAACLGAILIWLLASLLTTSAVAADATSQPASQIASPVAVQAPGSETGTDELERALYKRLTPSLVGVKFTWNYELGRIELVGPGVVVSEQGLVMVPLDAINGGLPDKQLRDFKILIPSREHDTKEIDAVFMGRDERNSVAFVMPKATTTSGPGKSDADKNQTIVWHAIKFVSKPLDIGDCVYSVGLLGKPAGYESYIARSHVSATLRGDIPQVLAESGLTSVGSVVVDPSGDAVGWVNAQNGQLFLSSPGGARQNDPLIPIYQPPRMFTASAEFLQSLADPPSPGHPIRIPWMGLPGLTGLQKEVAEVFGLQDQPAVYVGDVIPDSPAERAGIKQDQVIVKINGQPMPRGDEPDDTADMLRRMILRMKPGDVVKLTAIDKPGAAPHELSVKLEERPPRPNTAERFYAEDLGFGVRDVTFEDTYARHKPRDTKGVVVTVLKNGAPAAAAHLQPNDLVSELDGQSVTSLGQFKQVYQSLRKDRSHDAAVMVVNRLDGTTQTIRVEAPQ